jgi:hypothetical protein
MVAQAIIPALRRLREEGHEFEARLATEIPCLNRYTNI